MLDDHVVVEVPPAGVDPAEGSAGSDVLATSDAAYRSVGLTLEEAKRQRYENGAVIWGARISSAESSVGGEPEKLRLLVVLPCAWWRWVRALPGSWSRWSGAGSRRYASAARAFA